MIKLKRDFKTSRLQVFQLLYFFKETRTKTIHIFAHTGINLQNTSNQILIALYPSPFIGQTPSRRP